MSNQPIDRPADHGDESWRAFWTRAGPHILPWLEHSLGRAFPNLQAADRADVLANTLLRLWDKRDDYREELGRFVDWCWIIARNTAVDFFRSRQLRRAREAEVWRLARRQGTIDEVGSTAEARELEAAINGFLHSLPKEAQRSLLGNDDRPGSAEEERLIDRFLESLSEQGRRRLLAGLDDSSQSRSAASYRVRLHRIRKALSDFLTEQGHDIGSWRPGSHDH